MLCEIDNIVKYSCGLNHLGDGNYYIILATRNLKRLKKDIGDPVSLEIYEDPNPLGVKIPDVLNVLLEQDDNIREVFDNLTDGKKRSLIFSINRIKDIDLQVQKILKFIEENCFSSK